MILRAVVLLLAFAAPASATVDAWPALYDVAGVSEDDVLNIRAEPSASSEIIGGFAPDETAVEVMEMSRDGNWGRVNADERSGWASLAFLDRRPGQWAGEAPLVTRCLGTEPFWSLATGDGGATFKTPEALPLDFDRTARLSSRNRIDRYAQVYENDLGGLVATLRNNSCSDGMSHRAYGWEIDLLFIVAGQNNAQLFSGCCSIAPD